MNSDLYLEKNISQQPAINLLTAMGYTYISPADCDKQRGSRYHVLLRDILRGQLSQPPKEYGTALSKPAAAIVGNVLTNVIARPQFIAYKIGPKPLSVRLCEAMGAVRAGWTSRAWTHERDYDIVIFEHYRPGAWFRADI